MWAVSRSVIVDSERRAHAHPDQRQTEKEACLTCQAGNGVHARYFRETNPAA